MNGQRDVSRACPRLSKVALPIREISAESVRDFEPWAREELRQLLLPQSCIWVGLGVWGFHLWDKCDQMLSKSSWQVSTPGLETPASTGTSSGIYTKPGN